MKEEIWKPIPNYEGIYEASSYGRIRTCVGKTTFTKKHGVRHWKQRVLKYKSSSYKTGFRVTLWKNGKGKDYLVARLVASAFYGESNLTVNHIDGNRLNNRIENIEWCSLQDNIKKGFSTGLYDSIKQPVKVVVLATGEEKTFNSCSEASKAFGHSHGYINGLIGKKSKKFRVFPISKDNNAMEKKNSP